MNYNPQNERISKSGAYPQSESGGSEQRKGRRQFNVHKNGQSSGMVFGYSQYPDERVPVSQPDPGIKYQVYTKNPPMAVVPQPQAGVKFEPTYRDINPYPGVPTSKYPEKYVEPATNYYKDVPEEVYSKGYQYDEGKLDPSSNYDDQYPDEIEKLKEAIKRREEELMLYQASVSRANKEEPQDFMYGRVNKEVMDRQRLDDQKKLTSFVLTEQMGEKNRVKMAQQQEKEREQVARLEVLRRMKEEEAFEKMEKARKMREYREQLEVQNMVKTNMKQQERMSELDPQEYNPKVNSSLSALQQREQSYRVSKPMQKGEGYNPITGLSSENSAMVKVQGRDLSGYFRTPNENDPMIAGPTGQMQNYTRKNPKPVQSFPITGNAAGYEWKEGQEYDVGKIGEKNLAGYGQRLVQNRNPIYG